jgi:glyoxylase-like metal-dependent hydrolase (beta-lactamase superfamily II)
MASKGIGKWKLTTIDCGWHIANKINLTPGFDNMSIKLPYLAFLLQDGERNILVDNGINERFLIDGKAWGGAPADCGEKDLVNSLAKIGLLAKDIDAVIYTHLHNDHAGNSQLFVNTPSYAQRDDFDNLLNPCFAETPRRDFDFDVIPFLKGNRDLILIEGDLDFTEGIKLIKTPGHTRGSQSVVVNTTNGLRIMVGDLFHLRCQCFPLTTEMMDYDGKKVAITPAPETWPTIPSTLIYNYYAYYESYHKVRSYCPEWKPEYLICGHEPSHLHGEI